LQDQPNTVKAAEPQVDFCSYFSAAFGTIFIFRAEEIAAVRTVVRMAVVHANDGQVFFPQGNGFPMLNGASQIRVNGINRPTAVGNGKILFAPLKKGNEKEAEIGIDHKNGNAAVATAFFADHGLPEKIKILSPLGDPADKYHKNTPFRMKIL